MIQGKQLVGNDCEGIAVRHRSVGGKILDHLRSTIVGRIDIMNDAGPITKVIQINQEHIVLIGVRRDEDIIRRQVAIDKALRMERADTHGQFNEHAITLE